MREHFNPWMCILCIYMYVSRFMTYITIYVHRTCDSVMCDHIIQSMWWWLDHIQGRIQDFKVGGSLKKIAPSGGRHENFWGISCEKLRFYAKKSYFFQLWREARKLYLDFWYFAFFGLQLFCDHRQVLQVLVLVDLNNCVILCWLMISQPSIFSGVTVTLRKHRVQGQY